MVVKERCRRVERRAARISCTLGDGAGAAGRRGPRLSHQGIALKSGTVCAPGDVAK